MAHSFVSALFHCVWSTKHRRKVIKEEFRERLLPYLGGIAKTNNMKALAIGGIEDHVHVLLSLPSTKDIAKAVQLIKGGSSKWVHDTFPEHRQFGGLRSVQHRYLASRGYDSLHRHTGRTSSAANIPGGIPGVPQETQHRLRSALYLGLIVASSQPSLRNSDFISSPNPSDLSLAYYRLSLRTSRDDSVGL